MLKNAIFRSRDVPLTGDPKFSGGFVNVPFGRMIAVRNKGSSRSWSKPELCGTPKPIRGP